MHLKKDYMNFTKNKKDYMKAIKNDFGKTWMD